MKRLTHSLVLLALLFSFFLALGSIPAALATSTWENVNTPGFSDGVASNTSLALDGSGTPYVAYSDSAHSNFAAPAEVTLTCAAAITVANANDSDAGSLRQAIADVCAGGAIDFDTSLAGQTITLASQLEITKTMTIDAGALASPVTVSGNRLVRVFMVTAGDASINGLTIAHGNGVGVDCAGSPDDACGGGLFIQPTGVVTITHSTFISNTAVGNPAGDLFWMGGAIFNLGKLTVLDSLFTDNTSIMGSAIYSLGSGASILIERTAFVGNHGVSYIDGSPLIDIDSGSTATVRDSLFEGNTGGSAIYNLDSTLWVQNSTFYNNSTNNYGGALWLSFNSTTTVQNSTFSHNGAIAGGAINVYGNARLTLQNSTLSDNVANHINPAWVYGGGIVIGTGGILTATNNIIANSLNGGDCQNYGTLITNTNNLVEDGSCSPALSGDPQLGPLTDNGGQVTAAGYPLLTHALQTGSQAIDAGSGCPAADQRGRLRPQDGDGNGSAVCDLGAYEQSSGLGLNMTATPATDAPYHGLVTYTIYLTNTSGVLQSGLRLTDTLPAGIAFENWIVSPTLTALNGATITWQGNLAIGQARTWSFTARNTGTLAGPGDYGSLVDNVVQVHRAADPYLLEADAPVTVTCGELTVQQLEYDGACGLRRVMARAPAGSTIHFRQELDGGTIGLISPHKDFVDQTQITETVVITRDLNVDASALPDSIRLDGLNSLNVLIKVKSEVHSTLNNLTLQHARAAADYDGALHVNAGAFVTLTHSSVISNTGNHILDNGLSDGTVGGIFNHGHLLVQDSLIGGNTGSGILNMGRIYGLTPEEEIYLSLGSILTVTHSVIAGNTDSVYAGGGIFNNHGMATIEHSLIYGNQADYGGGIYSWTLYEDLYISALFVRSSMIRDNSAGTGAGINLLGTAAVLENDTIANNLSISSYPSGGIWARADLTITNCTLSGNEQNFIYSGMASHHLNLSNTIIANDTVSPSCSITGGTVNAANNLVEDGTCSPALSGDPRLGPLADNGGGLPTMALLPGSPAIDAGANCPATDQRGIPRPQGAACDIGAYEAQPNLVLNKSVTPNTTVPYQGVVTYTIMFSNTGALTDTNVLLTDTLPTAITFGAWLAQPAGTVRAGNTFTWTGALTPTNAVTFVFTATRGISPRGWVTNTAYFSGTAQAGSAAAGFQVMEYAITPTAGVGGTITPSDVQIVNPGEERVFTIAPNYGYHILDVGVDGTSVGAVNVYTFTNVTADHTITATFGLNAYALTTNAIGQGQITRTPNQATYLFGSVVTLTAIPEAGWYLGQWSGDASGTLTQTTVLMNANKVVTATFFNTPQTYYTLTLGLIGSGIITPTVGAHSYLSGTLIDLSATPAAGWQFIGWGGDADCADGAVTMNAHKLCTATFARYRVYLPLVLR